MDCAHNIGIYALGSSLIRVHQMMMVAMATAEAKLIASLSHRVAMWCPSLSLHKAYSIRFLAL